MKQSLLSASASASAQVTQTLKRPLDSLKRRWQDCQRSSWGTVKPDEDSPFIPQSLNRIERRCTQQRERSPAWTVDGGEVPVVAGRDQDVVGLAKQCVVRPQPVRARVDLAGDLVAEQQLGDLLAGVLIVSSDQSSTRWTSNGRA